MVDGGEPVHFGFMPLSTYVQYCTYIHTYKQSQRERLIIVTVSSNHEGCLEDLNMGSIRDSLQNCGIFQYSATAGGRYRTGERKATDDRQHYAIAMNHLLYLM